MDKMYGRTGCMYRQQSYYMPTPLTLLEKEGVRKGGIKTELVVGQNVTRSSKYNI